jgi:hypothetical protein
LQGFSIYTSSSWKRRFHRRYGLALLTDRNAPNAILPLPTGCCGDGVAEGRRVCGVVADGRPVTSPVAVPFCFSLNPSGRGALGTPNVPFKVDCVRLGVVCVRFNVGCVRLDIVDVRFDGNYGIGAPEVFSFRLIRASANSDSVPRRWRVTFVTRDRPRK